MEGQVDIVDMEQAMEALDRDYAQALEEQRRANDLLVAAHRKIRQVSEERRLLLASKGRLETLERSAQPVFA